MDCWHCQTKMSWCGEHDAEDEDELYVSGYDSAFFRATKTIITHFNCPKCRSVVLVYYPRPITNQPSDA